MKRALAAFALGALAAAPDAAAHGIGGVRDLPVPLWLFYYGASAALLLSFVALGVLWRRARLDDPSVERPLPRPVDRAARSSVVRVAGGGLGVFLFLVVLIAAVAGTTDPLDNLAPTFIYVIFWLGLVPLVVLFGNVWALLNPWRALADLWVWAAERSGVARPPLAEYPERLGRWPAAVLLAAFAALELAFYDPSDPRMLAVAVVVYSYVTWIGMAAFGRATWLANGEAFTVYFGLLSRVGPIAKRAGRLVVRPPLYGLGSPERRPGTIAFIAVMLGSVGFDGFSRATVWKQWRADLLGNLDPGFASNLVSTLFNLAGLVVAIVLVALAYWGAIWFAHALAGGSRLADAFVLSLVPIALAYVVAHYFSLLVIQGQYLIPLASDPLGRGWDLFGTADYRVNLARLTPNVVWYVQVAALIVGHVAGLVLAHDRAVAIYRSSRDALRAQYAMLVLMVLYTVAGLWLLSRG